MHRLVATTAAAVALGLCATGLTAAQAANSPASSWAAEAARANPRPSISATTPSRDSSTTASPASNLTGSGARDRKSPVTGEDAANTLTRDHSVNIPPATLAATASDSNGKAPGGVKVAAAQLDDGGGLRIVELDVSSKKQAARKISGLQADPDTLAVSIPVPATLSDIADDSLRYSQWAFTELPMEWAWGTSTGAGATIAIIDTGVDLAHPDLVGKLVPGIDKSASANPTPQDLHGHGTHVAGIAAASTNNSVGIAGVAPYAKLMPVKVFDNYGAGWSSGIAEGLLWAVDHGATVANMSLVVGGHDPVLKLAVDYAEANGVVVVAASGNSRTTTNTVNYPAAYSSVIAVAASGSNRTDSGFSNTGAHIDITAPGVNIMSTTRGANYASWSGTSMASPFVAGVAALMQSANPSFTPDQVEARLRDTATDMGAVGMDDIFGAGLVDPAAAVGGPTPPPPAPPAPAPAPPPPAAPAQDPPSAPDPDEPDPDADETPPPPPVKQCRVISGKYKTVRKKKTYCRVTWTSKEVKVVKAKVKLIARSAYRSRR